MVQRRGRALVSNTVGFELVPWVRWVQLELRLSCKLDGTLNLYLFPLVQYVFIG